MANNVFADKPAAVVAKSSISFASAGLDETKVRIIYEVGDPLKSFVPGRAINAISGFTQDKGYYMIPAIDLDLSAILAPPLDAANITPPAPTAGIVDDTANTFDWTNAAGYVTADHETSINGGTTWQAATKPLSVGNVALAIGQVLVRVKAATGRNAGPTLANASAFTTGDTTAPTVTSATAIDATTIRVVFSEVVTDSITAGSMGFKKNGAALTPTARSGSGTNTIDYTVPAMVSTDTILRTYNPATGDIKDAAGNELGAFTDVAVTNSVPAGAATIASTTWFSRKDPSVGATTSGTSPVLITNLNDLSGLYPWSVPGGTAPEYQVNGFGTGKAGIKLDTNKALGTATYATALAKPYTRIAVVKFNSMPAAGIGKYFFYSNSPSAESNASIVGTAGNCSMWGGPGAPLVASAALSIGPVYIIFLEYKGDGANDKIYVNNVLKATGNAGSHINMTGERIGEVGGASADCLLGDVLIYAGIFTDTDRTSIYNELAAKYGI